MKKNVLTIFTLFMIASLSGLLLFTFNQITKPIIEKNMQAKVEKMAQEIFPQTSKIESTPIQNTNYVSKEITCYNKDHIIIGYLYMSSGNNSFGSITLLTGIFNERVIRVEFLKLDQSYGDIAKYHTNQVYNSEDLSFQEIENIEVKSGATYSSKLIKNLVLESSKVYGERHEK